MFVTIAEVLVLIGFGAYVTLCWGMVFVLAYEIWKEKKGD